MDSDGPEPRSCSEPSPPPRGRQHGLQLGASPSACPGTDTQAGRGLLPLLARAGIPNTVRTQADHPRPPAPRRAQDRLTHPSSVLILLFLHCLAQIPQSSPSLQLNNTGTDVCAPPGLNPGFMENEAMPAYNIGSLKYPQRTGKPLRCTGPTQGWECTAALQAMPFSSTGRGSPAGANQREGAGLA